MPAAMAISSFKPCSCLESRLPRTDKHTYMTRTQGFCTGNTMSRYHPLVVGFFSLGFRFSFGFFLWLLRYRGADYSFHLFSNASRTENKCACESTNWLGGPTQHALHWHTYSSSLPPAFSPSLPVASFPIGLLLHCELQHPTAAASASSKIEKRALIS